MKLERVVTELPSAERLREVDMATFKHRVFEDVQTGHLYIMCETANHMSQVQRLTND